MGLVYGSSTSEWWRSLRVVLYNNDLCRQPGVRSYAADLYFVHARLQIWPSDEGKVRVEVSIWDRHGVEDDSENPPVGWTSLQRGEPHT